MKLHLGCGNRYIPGFINIDVQDLDNVDVRADAVDLPYEKNSIDFRTCRKWGSAKKYAPTKAKTRVLKMQIMKNQN